MLLDILNMIGIIACAVTGALQAGRVKMDYFGVVVIAMVTGLGGGTIRDMMFQNYPLSWVGEPIYLYVACGFAIVTIIVAPFMRYLKTVFLILDAMGMIAFSLLGAQVAINLGYGVTLASVAGVCTGVFGGVIRDLLCNRIPIAFKHELYASISLATVFVYYFMLKFGLGYGVSVVVSVLFGFIFRVLAIRYNWSLPVFDYDDDKYLNVNFLENLPHKRLKRKVRQLAIHYYRKKHPYRKKVQQANLTISTEEPTNSDLSAVITADHIDYDLQPVVEQTIASDLVVNVTESKDKTSKIVTKLNSATTDSELTDKTQIPTNTAHHSLVNGKTNSNANYELKDKTKSEPETDAKGKVESKTDAKGQVESATDVNTQVQTDIKVEVDAQNISTSQPANSTSTTVTSEEIEQEYDLQSNYSQLSNQQYQTSISDHSNYPTVNNSNNATESLALGTTGDSSSLPPKQPADS